MNVRTLALTVAALLILCGLAWFLQRPEASASTDPRVDQPVLPAEVATQAAQIRLEEAGKTIGLTRQANGSWLVPSYHDLPADFTKLTQFIEGLTEARVQRVVTARPDRLARLEFKGTAVTFLDAAGKELWHLALGKNAEEGGLYVRFGTEEKAYLVNYNLWVDAEARNWANAALLDLKPDDLARVEIGFADPAIPPVVATRAKKGDPWVAAAPPAGKRLKLDRITSLVPSLTSLRFTDTTAPDDANAVAARANSRTLRIATFDGRTCTIVLGRKPEVKKPKTPAPAGTTQATPAPTAPNPPEASKEPEFETIPAGPVFAFITSSEAQAPVNSLMKKLACQVGEWVYTGLPAAPADLWEDVPAAPAAPATGPKPAETSKP